MVESVGEGVTELKAGDVVMPTYVGECGKCDNCRSGKTNLCHTYPLPFSGLMPDGTSRMSINADGEGGGERKDIYHLFTCATWSEYMVIDVNYVVKLDPRIPLQHASFLSCGYSTGFGSTWKEASVHEGSTVAVLGLGAVGLGAIEGARTQGAAQIIGVDINVKKCEKGKVFGMTDFINPKDTNKPISELVKERTGGLGADYCFECTGIPAFLNEAIESTKMELHLDELWTHEVCLDEINKAFEVMKQADCLKVVIKF
ncbi:GroES-like zinc-binding dehydrogenase family protein [Actinidia rufa]|uniref:GroES-like zinc-binding dehydrogenase family protein n=1 Tax=Actinidia rufa TaxID=165716 RepID=A0A7J0DZ95_9ERIC|nr:GroES-like zinc-binding dehydrogenase family protein [Actinidia rufa]